MTTSALAFFVAALGAAQPPARGDVLDSLPPLQDAALAGARGGFRWGGMQISLGADMRTFVDGELALHTLVSWSAAGSDVTRRVGGALSPASAEQLRAGVLMSGGITMRVGDQAVFLANEGRTALMHRTDGAIQNVLVNTASNTDLRQEVDVALELAGYDQFAAGIGAQRLGHDLGVAVGALTSDALSR